MRSLGAIALVCIGLAVLSGALSMVQFAVLMSSGVFDSSSAPLYVVLVWLPVVAAVAAGIVLIRKRHELAARWFDDSPAPLAMEPRTVLHLAFVVIGVVLAARAIPDLLSGIAHGVNFSTEDFGYAGSVTHWSWVWGDALISSVLPLAELVVGGLLVAYSGRLADRLWSPQNRLAASQSASADAACPECGATTVAPELGGTDSVTSDDSPGGSPWDHA